MALGRVWCRSTSVALRPDQLFPRSGRLRSTASVGAEEVHGAATSDSTRPSDWGSAKPYEQVPGPKPVPILGNAWRFLPMIGEYSKMKPKDLLFEMHRTYGPILALRGMPGRPDILMLADPDLFEKIFRNEGPWPVRQGGDSLEYYFKHVRKNVLNSLIAEQGKPWQEFRTAVNQVMMQPKNVKMYVEPIEKVAEEFIDKMWKMRDDKGQMPDDFVDELAKWSLESIVFVALDHRLGALKENLDPDSEPHRVIECVRTLFQAMYDLDFQPSVWKYVSTPAFRRFIACMNEFTAIASRHVNNAVERLKVLSEEERGDRHYSVLERLLLANDDPRKGVAMALDMMLAGVDTTSALTSIALYQLASNPEKQKKLHEELDRVLPDPKEPLTKEKLEELKYLRACIKESNRVEPAILGNARTTVKDMVLGGYQIPKGTRASFNHPMVLQSEKYVPRAAEFLPERWLPGGESLRPKHPFAFLPFGFGPRMCAGRRFADMEIEVLLTKIFRNYTLEWHHPPPETDVIIILRYRSPLKLTMIPRS